LACAADAPFFFLLQLRIGARLSSENSWLHFLDPSFYDLRRCKTPDEARLACAKNTFFRDLYGYRRKINGMIGGKQTED
jgi:hypothetical protein